MSGKEGSKENAASPDPNQDSNKDPDPDSSPDQEVDLLAEKTNPTQPTVKEPESESADKGKSSTSAAKSSPNASRSPSPTSKSVHFDPSKESSEGKESKIYPKEISPQRSRSIQRGLDVEVACRNLLSPDDPPVMFTGGLTSPKRETPKTLFLEQSSPKSPKSMFAGTSKNNSPNRSPTVKFFPEDKSHDSKTPVSLKKPSPSKESVTFPKEKSAKALHDVTSPDKGATAKSSKEKSTTDIFCGVFKKASKDDSKEKSPSALENIAIEMRKKMQKRSSEKDLLAEADPSVIKTGPKKEKRDESSSTVPLKADANPTVVIAEESDSCASVESIPADESNLKLEEPEPMEESSDSKLEKPEPMEESDSKLETPDTMEDSNL